MLDTVADRLLAAVAARRDEVATLTAALVRIPSVNPPGEAYAECCEALALRLGRRRFKCEYLRAEGTPGDSDAHPRLNIVCRHESGRPGPTVHFNSHIDVVAAGAGWTVDPFGGAISDGKVWGRGTADMKGGLAASIVAAEALIDEGLAKAGAIEISGTADEETGGYGGVAWLAQRGYFSPPRVDHVIIPEPLSKDCVCLGHRGVWWATLELRGRIAHGSMPFLGRSAIRDMAAVLDRVERELYPRLAARHTAMPVIPEGARASTLNWNSLHGGEAELTSGYPSALVADRCRAVLDRRFLVEEKLEDVRGEFVALLEAVRRERPGMDYSLADIWAVDPTMTAPDAPVVRALDGAIARVLGAPSRHVASPGTYDQKHIARFGHLHDCVAYGPGRLELAHQPDEHVAIDDLVQSAQVMALAAARLLGTLT